MDQPSAYRSRYVVNRNCPYEMVERLPSGDDLGGGVLRKGQQVWMQYEPQAATYRNAVSVYVEETGIINLNSHCLSRLDWDEPTTFKETADQGQNINEIELALQH